MPLDHYKCCVCYEEETRMRPERFYCAKHSKENFKERVRLTKLAIMKEQENAVKEILKSKAAFTKQYS